MVVVGDGPSKRVGPKGLLVGRQKDCDIVSLDPEISRRHALIRLTPDCAEIIPLGRTPIEINGKPRDRVHALADGDTIVMPGLQLAVQIRVARVDVDGAAAFRLVRTRGGSFGIVHSPFVLGGGDTDDLIIKRWPPAAIRIHVAQRELFVEVMTGKATCNARELGPGSLEPFAIGDTLTYRKEQFVVRSVDAAAEATTNIAGVDDLPTEIVIEMLPRGGRVVMSVGDGERAVYLADRQLDLVIALLRPPPPLVAGELVPDDTIREIVWPRNPGVSRPEINMLISRCRRVLVEAGLAGPRLIVRSPGGGATRFALAPACAVTLVG